MRKSFKALGVVAALGAGIPASATAAEVFNWSGCGGQNFASCATVIASWDAGTNVLTFSVRNDNTTPGWLGDITTVGWLGLGNSIDTKASTGPTDWTWAAKSQGGLAGDGKEIWVSSDAKNPDAGIQAGLTENFTLKFTAAPSFTNFTFGLRETGFPEGVEAYGACGGSNRLHVNKAGEVYTEVITREGAEECYPGPDDPNTEIPEPATMVLLATGLVGLAGAQLRRRKNSKV